MKRIVVIGLLVLAGCSTQLYKPGATREDFARDLQACQYQVQLASGVVWPDEVEMCMATKNWTRTSSR